MTFGINTAMGEGGDFLPILKFNTDAGRLIRVDRAQNPATGTWEKTEVELGQGTQLVFDFGCVEIGWVLFAGTGMAPSWAMTPYGTLWPAQPTPQHRAGFRMHVWNPNVGLREFGATSKVLVGAVQDLHTLFETSPEAVQGLVPVVKLTGTTPVPMTTPKGKKTYYRPVFTIERWIERRPEFGDRTVAPPQPKVATQSAGAGWGQEAAKQQAYQQANQQNPRHAPPPPARDVDEWGSAAAVPMAASGASHAQLEDDEIPF